MRPAVFPEVPLAAHALVDSGEGEKLERFGELLLRRPDPQALWPRRLPSRDWQAADLTFVRESDRGGRWEPRGGAKRAALGREPEWTIDVEGLALVIRPTPFKHVGLFPEQATNWAWLEGLRARLDLREPRLLNLFGYTGAASLLAQRSGWKVTHVDASRLAIDWLRENQERSGLGRAGLRTILDDALAFARREVRRESRYEAILLDPPHYGRGPKGETWRFEEGIAPLLEACSELLAERSGLVLSTYAIGYSPLALSNLLLGLGAGEVAVGELAIGEAQVEGKEQRLLPCGFCGRWER